MLSIHLVSVKINLRANLVAVKMSPNQRYHHGSLKEALIDQASEILEKEGAEAITFRRLARELDVSHSAPGHHFADRRELLAELAADGYAGLSEAMEEARAGLEPDEWLNAIGRAYVRFGLANPERYRMMFASRLLAGDCPERLTDESSRAYLLLLEAARQGLPQVDPETYFPEVAEAGAWAMVHGIVMLWLDAQLGPVGTEGQLLDLADGILSTHFA